MIFLSAATWNPTLHAQYFFEVNSWIFACSHLKSRAKKNELLHFASLRSAICPDLVENDEEILTGCSFLAKQHGSFSWKKIWFWWFPVVLLEDYLTCLLQEIGRRITCWHLKAGNLKEKQPPILLRYCLIYNLIPSFLSDGPAFLRIWILGRT